MLRYNYTKINIYSTAFIHPLILINWCQLWYECSASAKKKYIYEEFFTRHRVYRRKTFRFFLFL